jgi:hypothetical protein
MDYWLALVGIVSTNFIAIGAAVVVYVVWRQLQQLHRSVENLQHEVTRLHVRLDMREAKVSRIRAPARTS